MSEFQLHGYDRYRQGVDEKGSDRASRVEIRSEREREQGGGHGVVAWNQRHVVVMGVIGREALW